jgi:hypothetical protein
MSGVCARGLSTQDDQSTAGIPLTQGGFPEKTKPVDKTPVESQTSQSGSAWLRGGVPGDIASKASRRSPGQHSPLLLGRQHPPFRQ